MPSAAATLYHTYSARVRPVLWTYWRQDNLLLCMRCWVKKMPLMLSWWKRVAGSSQPCMVNQKELQYLHQEERETTPDKGVTTHRSKSAASHEESSPAGDVVESSRSARSSHFGHHQVRMGHEERASITFAWHRSRCSWRSDWYYQLWLQSFRQGL